MEVDPLTGIIQRLELDLLQSDLNAHPGLIDELLARLPARGPDALAPIAALPMDIRGYGPVKDAAVARVKAAAEQKLSELSTAAAKEAA